MKTSKYYIILGFALTLLFACKKEADPNNQTTQPNNTNEEFIEFKIDGSFYRIESFNSGSSIMAYATAQLLDFGSYKGLIFRFVNMSPLEIVGFSIYDSNYPVKNHYDISFDVNQAPIFNPSEFGFIMSDENQFMVSVQTTGSFDFTRIDSVIGGVVEGTFNLNKLSFADSDGNPISSGHTLTEGKFKTFIQ